MDESSEDVFGYGHYFLGRTPVNTIEGSNFAADSTLLRLHILCTLVDECEQLFVHNRLKSGEVPRLNPAFLVSVTNFLLQMYKKGIYKQKIKLLFSVLPSYFEAAIITSTLSEQYAIFNIIGLIMLCITDKKKRIEYINLNRSLMGQLKTPCYTDNIPAEFCKAAIFNFLYAEHTQFSGLNYVAKLVSLFDYEVLKGEVQKFQINIYEYIDGHFDNCGLRFGLAGVGMAVLDLSESNIQI